MEGVTDRERQTESKGGESECECRSRSAYAWPVHSTGVYESVAIGEESLSLQPNPGPPVDDSVLCGPLQGLFFTTRNCW